MRTLIVILWALCALLGAGRLQAQPVPDAGALQRQFQAERALPLPPRGTEAARSPAQPLPLADGVTLTVQAFAFSGNTLLRDSQLEPALRAFLARPLGHAELQAAARAAADAYRDAGFLVTTELPPQDVTDGIVTIRIVEARFAGVRVDAPQPTRIDAQKLQDIVLAQQAPGEPLRAEAIDRALLLADDLPGVVVSAALEPGTRDGETVLALRARDEPAFSGSAAVDNAGARSTGVERATLTARANSPLGLGDQASVDVQRSRGAHQLRLGWSLPVGDQGMRLGLNVSHFGYRLVGPDFAALGARGRSQAAAIDLTRPLLRARKANLYAQASLDHRRMRNVAQGNTQSRYQATVAAVGLAGNLYDDWGGATSGNLSVARGRIGLGTLEPSENPQLAGGFSRLRWSLAREQALWSDVSASLRLSGQLAPRALDSSERFYLGGPAGVRAYPVNEGSGSRGALLNLALQWHPLPGLQASVFYDRGRASTPGGSAPAVTLQGAGVALQFEAPGGIDLQASLARRIGSNPNPGAAGRDQDGSLKKLRPWLQLSIAF